MTNILVIDDELSMREFMRILLEKEGFSVSTAGNASEAFTLLDAEVPDLVISDIKLIYEVELFVDRQSADE